MRKSVPLYLLLLVALVGCASHGVNVVPSTAAQNADKAYGVTSAIYMNAQSAIVEARRAGLVSQTQWNAFDTAQHTVAATAPSVRSMIELWKSWGPDAAAPPDYAATIAKLTKAVADISAIYSEVKR